MSQPIANRAGLLKFVPGVTQVPEAVVYHGLDLGLRQDHSALAGIELCWHICGRCPTTYATLFQPQLVIRSLKRFPLGTTYEQVVDLVTTQITARSLRSQLVIDAGGPGPPIVETMRRRLPAGTAIRPVIITGGRGQNSLTGGYTGIPRRTLVSNLLLAIGTGSIVCEDDVDGWQHLEEEMVELRGDTTHPASARAHDDLVMAVSLALSAAVDDRPILLPSAPHAEPNAIGYQSRPLY